MKSLFTILILSLVAILPVAAVEPVTVAVLNFDTAEEVPVGRGDDAATLLTALLSAGGDLELVERQALEKILSETELSLSGTISNDTAVAVGQLTGARILVTGRIFGAGKTNYVIAKVMSAENGRVFGITEKFVGDDDWGGAVELIAERATELIAEKRGDLLVRQESPEERLVRLGEIVDGKELPKVFVHIPEEHITRAIPDPAAETEIQKTLQDLGFVIVGQSSQADAVITGEAFSEVAGRRANLISCRARVEVSLSWKGSDQIHVDRQTSVAIDLAENVAAKSALQSAGATVAERLIPELVK